MHIYGARALFASFKKTYHHEFEAYLWSPRSCCFMREVAKTEISRVFMVYAHIPFFGKVGGKPAFCAHVRCLRPVSDEWQASEKARWVPTVRLVDVNVSAFHAYLRCSRRALA